MKEKYSIIRSADRYIEQRQFGKAIKVYQSLIDSGEQDPSIINALGDLQYKNGDRSSAIKNYGLAAAVYSDSGDSLKAVGICRKILRNSPENTDALELFLDLNQKRDAVFESKSLLSELVEDAIAGGDYSRAAELQERMARISRKDPGVFLLLAEYQFASGSREQAAESAGKALDLAKASKSEASGWKRVGELLDEKSRMEGFPEFVKDLAEGYPASAGTSVPAPAEVSEEEIPPPAPPAEDDLAISRFFEVEGSLESLDELEAGEESGLGIPGGFDLEESPEPEETKPVSAGETEPAGDDFPIAAKDAGAEEIFAALNLGEEEETSTEFELDIDENDMAGSREELLEMLGTGYQEEISPEEEPLAEEVAEEFEAGEVVESREANGFELDLDQVDLSLDDFESLGIENLDENGEAGFEPAGEIAEAGGIAGTEQAEAAGKVVGGAEEIEAALEGIFSGQAEAGEPGAGAIPEGTPEQEYPSSEEGGTGMASIAGSGVPAGPDNDPDVQVELGIAYRDMALLEDAIGKFENALTLFEGREDKDKCVLCCQLLAECCNRLERFSDTLNWVARGLDYRKVSDDEIVRFEYESALALEALGDYSESLSGFRRIQSIHPGFRDVESRISSLESAEH